MAFDKSHYLLLISSLWQLFSCLQVEETVSKTLGRGALHSGDADNKQPRTKIVVVCTKLWKTGHGNKHEA